MTKLIGGRAQLGGQTYNDTHTGTMLVTAANAIAISAVTVACFEVLVQADPGNDDNVVLGNAKQGCTIVLTPGTVIVIPISDVENVTARAVSGGQRVNWMAMV